MKKSSQPIAGFVSTAVLTSSDGLFGDNVEEKRIADDPAPKEHDSDYRPLFDRLQELKEKKDSEWKEKNNPFAPPKALDDEEIGFIRDLENKRAETHKQRKFQQDNDLAEFMMARESAKRVESTSSTSKATVCSSISEFKEPLKTLQEPLDQRVQVKTVCVLKPKRKSCTIERKHQQKKNKVEVRGVTVSTVGGLVGYDSDSDSESEDDAESDLGRNKDATKTS